MRISRNFKPFFRNLDHEPGRSHSFGKTDELAGMTPQHLCTVFKKATSLTIFQYINSFRIKKSKELLLQYPQLRIKEIAYRAGFEDANYFCTVFKKHEQLSPNQFRKIH